jgi:hypothetical protein
MINTSLEPPCRGEYVGEDATGGRLAGGARGSPSPLFPSHWQVGPADLRTPSVSLSLSDLFFRKKTDLYAIFGKSYRFVENSKKGKQALFGILMKSTLH